MSLRHISAVGIVGVFKRASIDAGRSYLRIRALRFLSTSSEKKHSDTPEGEQQHQVEQDMLTAYEQ